MPKERNLRMPAEWEPQSAVWCAWPDNLETWPKNLLAAQIEFTAMVHSLAEFVSVHVMVNSRSFAAAEKRLMRADIRDVHLMNIATNDAWARDYGPTFVMDQADDSLVAIGWNYNAWGGKYPPFDKDQAVGKQIADGYQFPLLQPGLCFEGGAIETDGAGTILSTRSCALDGQRNSALAEYNRIDAFERAFATYLGAQHIIWLSGDAIQGDDTDGHIDQLVRFVDRDNLVYAWSADPTDAQRPALQQNLDDLRAGLDSLERSFVLHPLVIPAPFQFHGRQIPASYCNFVIANELVLVPQFGVPEDPIAIEQLAGLFPEHHVFGLPSRNLSVGLGSFHCLTQPVPRTNASSPISN